MTEKIQKTTSGEEQTNKQTNKQTKHQLLAGSEVRTKYINKVDLKDISVL
jgi:hypothetical protein